MLTDEYTKNKLKDRLLEVSQFGMTLYYLLEQGKINPLELDNIFFSDDDDKSAMNYCRLVKNILPCDLNQSFEKYKEEYPNNKDMTTIEYQNNLNLIYTSKLLEKLKSDGMGIDRTYLNTYNYLLEKVTVE